MSPLSIEFKSNMYGADVTVKIPDVQPGDLPGSLTDTSAGKRVVYLFNCSEDDSQSVISRQNYHGEIEFKEIPDRLVLTDRKDSEVVKVLRDGESYEVDVVTKEGISGRVKWTHKKG